MECVGAAVGVGRAAEGQFPKSFLVWETVSVDRIPALLGARHSAVPPIELRLAAVDEAEAVGETNRIGSVYSADRSR